MINLKKLDKEVDSLIERITKDDYEEWLIFDKVRAGLAYNSPTSHLKNKKNGQPVKLRKKIYRRSLPKKNKQAVGK